MTKQGFGDGAVVMLAGYYEKEVKTAIFNGADWIKNNQFTSQKNRTYTKQVVVGLQSSYERNLEGKPARNQYGYLYPHAFVAGSGESGEMGVCIFLNDIANPINGLPNNDKGYSCSLVQPSYTPYRITNDELAENIMLSQRLFMEPTDKKDRDWHNQGAVKGIPPL
jgi:hypothetical protein